MRSLGPASSRTDTGRIEGMWRRSRGNRILCCNGYRRFSREVKIQDKRNACNDLRPLTDALQWPALMSAIESIWDSRLDCAALTDIGMRRSNNQDSHAVVLAQDPEAFRQSGHFFMVADGMGAHAAGELASKLAVDGVAHLYQKYTERGPPESLQRAFVETNSEVHRRGQVNSDFRNMGTTASVLVLLPQGALVAHIGDSRVYRLRNKTISQLTFDHSLVWELKKAGQFNEQSDLANAIPKNVITRSLGPNASIQVDIEGPFPSRVDDIYLLCSDGLTGKLEDRELAGILRNLPADESAQLLIDLANLRGGPDNITVLVARVTNDSIASDTSEQEPLRIGRDTQNPAIEPIVWVSISVCLLVSLILMITDRPIIAFFAALFGGVVYCGAKLAKHRASRSGVSLTGERRLGRGPYTETACPPATDTSELLERLTREVRQQDEAGRLSIDWTQFDAACRHGDEAAAAGKTREAMQHRARAIRSLMSEVRRGSDPHQENDSVLDL
jgi:protein phosphatase